MNRLSIITVVKDDSNSLKSTYLSLSNLAVDHEWVVIDGGSDLETLEWMKTIRSRRISYIREKDKNLYDAMNKGIQLATGTHLLFINAGDELVQSEELTKVLSILPIDAGIIGCIRRQLNGMPNSSYSVNPSYFLKWILKHGIKPANHQATIYPAIFLENYPYDTELGLFADQVSILELLDTKKIQINRSLAICTFQNGGLGDKQSRAAFLRQMLKFNFDNGTKLQKFLLLLQLPIILLVKIIYSAEHRIRMLLLR